MSFSYPQERSRRRSSPPETTSFQSATREHPATREHIVTSEETDTRGQTRNHNVAQVTDSGNSHVNLNIDSAIDAHSALETQTQATENIDVPEQRNQSNNPDITNQLLAALLPFLTNALGNATQSQLQQNLGKNNQE